MRVFILAIMMFFYSLFGALAVQSDWVDVGLGAKIRLISSNEIDKQGHSFAALELKMPQDIKTYWRISGESGIVLQLDIAGSQGILNHEIIWPFPIREKKYGYLDFVYYGNLVLPIKLELQQKENIESAMFKASIFMGICSNICIPVNQSFELPMDFVKSDRSSKSKINLAISLAPLTWQEKENPIKKLTLDINKNQLEVKIDASIIDPLSLIVDNANPDVLFSLPQFSPKNSIVRFELLNGELAKGLLNKPINLSFQTINGAYMTSILVESSVND